MASSEFAGLFFVTGALASHQEVILIPCEKYFKGTFIIGKGLHKCKQNLNQLHSGASDKLHSRIDERCACNVYVTDVQ
jgi:hypothetical protein